MQRRDFIPRIVLFGVAASLITGSLAGFDRDAPPTTSIGRPGVPGEGFEGAWLGELWAPSGRLRVLLKLFEKDGRLSGSLDSLDEHVGGLQLRSVLQFGPEFQFKLIQPRARFRGSMDSTGAEIVGRWKQDGTKSWLILRRLDGNPANP